MDRIDELFADGQEIDRALQRAFRQAVLRHRQAGLPLVAWRDGRIVRIPPEEILVPNDLGEEPGSGSADGRASPSW